MLLRGGSLLILIQSFLCIVFGFLGQQSNQIIQQTPTRNDLTFYDRTTKIQVQPLRIVINGSSNLQIQSLENMVYSRCQCQTLSCKCCLAIKAKRFNFDSEVCGNVFYHTQSMSVVLQVLINSYAVSEFYIQLNKPKSFCLPILLPIYLFVCLKTYDIYMINDDVHICLALLLSLSTMEVFQISLGCVRAGPYGIQLDRRILKRAALV